MKEGGRKKNKPLIVFPQKLNGEVKEALLAAYREKMEQLDDETLTTDATIPEEPEAKSKEVVEQVPQEEQVSSEEIESKSAEADKADTDIPKLPATPQSPNPVVGDVIEFEHLSGQFIVIDTIDPSLLTLQASTGVTLKTGKKSRFQIVAHTDVIETQADIEE